MTFVRSGSRQKLSCPSSTDGSFAAAPRGLFVKRAHSRPRSCSPKPPPTPPSAQRLGGRSQKQRAEGNAGWTPPDGTDVVLDTAYSFLDLERVAFAGRELLDLAVRADLNRTFDAVCLGGDRQLSPFELDLQRRPAEAHRER